jgi:hypothetical protein
MGLGAVIKLIFILVICTATAFGEDKPDLVGPTLEERFQLITMQRDLLIKELQRIQAAASVQQGNAVFEAKAQEMVKKYGCQELSADFTCVKKQKAKDGTDK